MHQKRRRAQLSFNSSGLPGLSSRSRLQARADPQAAAHPHKGETQDGQRQIWTRPKGEGARWVIEQASCTLSFLAVLAMTTHSHCLQHPSHSLLPVEEGLGVIHVLPPCGMQSWAEFWSGPISAVQAKSPRERGAKRSRREAKAVTDLTVGGVLRSLLNHVALRRSTLYLPSC